MVMSDLSGCSHDSLLVMSIVEMVFIGIFVTTYFVIKIMSCYRCKCGSVFDHNNDIYSDSDDDISWFKQQSSSNVV